MLVMAHPDAFVFGRITNRFAIRNSTVFSLLRCLSSVLVSASLSLCNTAIRSDECMYFEMIATEQDQSGTTHRFMWIIL